MIDVCLLGTGGVMPLPERWLSSVLIRYNGRMILLDCGEGTQVPVKMAGWGFKAIDAVLLTHYHGDHVAGLPGLLLTIGNSGRTEPLILMGPPGLKKVVEGLTVIAPELPYALQIVELPEDKISENRLNGLVIRSIPADHTITCLSYCVFLKRQGKFDVEKAEKLSIPVRYYKLLQNGCEVKIGDRVIKPEMVLGPERKGIKVCYCTDTRPTESLVEFVRDADLLICEGMYGSNEDFEKAAQKKHMTFPEAAEIAKKANVQRLWLTHYSPSLTEPGKYIPQVRCIFPNAEVATDLITATLRFNSE
ncbi:ribonuclease Z [Thermoclostridium stercorarium subsp. stercorarium DSM 8532]|uniref:Ribonuclease Z n=3 Tax=Thermoclostridium stercorarium TaxID=1510 RepID=L7VKL9_THES1|nr:ribonuclease Z [Thermoclostridium stercorarium]AGC68655.1 ribonuclease Z [Thermoclostridium stercorarium subsp. stercorarium DSM 8532]AGI39668.1 ribonuclease Z [Thermoclostridium stercorarium subsp. stercorarium DSM 8532]ANW98994.1 ribonuclease Z [Thermoclostridium stercorarium subsp. thermolacticum DSM 2910]ANX01523.1 ribonuclease Z [Thermoclostridium stercorarium subsp. leptospartum DSM 9219]UZQ84638.1 ribonuclease Z [Thermoclostridium stercorarium]